MTFLDSSVLPWDSNQRVDSGITNQRSSQGIATNDMTSSKVYISVIIHNSPPRDTTPRLVAIFPNQ